MPTVQIVSLNKQVAVNVCSKLFNRILTKTLMVLLFGIEDLRRNNSWSTTTF